MRKPWMVLTALSLLALEGVLVSPSYAGARPRDFRSWAERLTRSGVLPPPTGRLIKSFDVAAACKELGFQEISTAYRTSAWLGERASGPDRVERIDVLLSVLADSLDARSIFFRDYAISQTGVTIAVGQANLSAEAPIGPGPGPSSIQVRTSSPVAGEFSTLGEDDGQPLSSVAFVRDNCAVRIALRPVIGGKPAQPDRDSGLALVQFAKGLDKLLMAAPHVEEGEKPWVPQVEAFLLELPMPAVGRPFTIDARISAAGEAAPGPRLRVSWAFYHKDELDRGVIRGEKSKTMLNATAARVELDGPGWWKVTCRAVLDRSLESERSTLLYVLPAGAEPEEAAGPNAGSERSSAQGAAPEGRQARPAPGR